LKVLVSLAAVAATALFYTQLWNPVVRLGSQEAHDRVWPFLAMALPWVVIVTIYRVGGGTRLRWTRWIALALVPPLLFGSAISLFGLHLIGGRVGGHQEVIAEAPWRETIVRVYRTDGGATTGFGVQVRQERLVLAGMLVLVRRIDGFYPCRSVEIYTTETGVRLAARAGDSCSGFLRRQVPPSKEYPLREFVHF